MRIIFLLLVLCFSTKLKAQKEGTEKLVAFKITDYIKTLTDSSVVVQVYKQASYPVAIPEKQLGVLHHCYKNGETLDTSMIGWGRCQLIKSEYYYFGLHLKKGQQPAAGDIIYVKVKVPYVHDGLLLNVLNHAVELTDVYGKNFLNKEAVFTNSKKDEATILDSMVSDIRYTGGAMLEQIPAQNQLLKGGLYDGKKLFESMQSVKRNELELFLKYMQARPKMYAGNTWKLSEIFATWMAGGTPTVVEN